MALGSFDKNQLDQARQFLLDCRSERSHPKRHRTIKRSKALSRAKRKRVEANLAAQASARRRFLELSRAYWSGQVDGHPSVSGG